MAAKDCPPSPPGDCIPFDADMACCDDWDSVDPDVADRAQALAWATIRTLSGYRTGNCPVIMRPCLTKPCDCCAGGWMNPVIVDGKWYNCVCGGPKCSCTKMCEISFPGEVARVDEINLGGELLTLSDYRIDNGYILVRMDGECWPSCQDLGAPVGAPNTLSVRYVPGILPGSAGLWAAGVLSCEFAKACSGAKCRLPSSVTSIARQGVAFQMAATMFEGGMTGIREVDAFLLAVNPAGLTRPSLVWSPDLPSVRHRYQTWP